MKKQTLISLLGSVSLQDLKNMIPIKARLDELKEKRKGLEKDLASINKKVDSLESLLSESGPRTLPGSLKKTKRQRIIQPSLSSLVVEILKEENTWISTILGNELRSIRGEVNNSQREQKC